MAGIDGKPQRVKCIGDLPALVRDSIYDYRQLWETKRAHLMWASRKARSAVGVSQSGPVCAEETHGPMDAIAHERKYGPAVHAPWRAHLLASTLPAVARATAACFVRCEWMVGRGLASDDHGRATCTRKHQTTSFTLPVLPFQQIYVDRLAVRLSSRSLEPNPARRAAVEVSCIPRKFGVPAHLICRADPRLNLQLALRRSAWQPAEESMKTRSAMGQTGRASSNPIN
eukprot:scaffold61861_cov79-Phaeocystis_antarctica.AAC.1